MIKGLQWAFWAIGLSLQLALILALTRGYRRDFPVLFAYVVCLLGTTAGEIFASLLLRKTSAAYLTYYWSAELIRQSILFALVVSLVMHAMPISRRAERWGQGIALFGAVIWFGSVAANYSVDLNAWMTAVVRNLSFFTGVLTLAAWFTYASTRNRDTQRLMIAGGLGLQMTGEAIGQAIRQLDVSLAVSLTGSIFIVLTHFICLFIWWRAFSTEYHSGRSVYNEHTAVSLNRE